MSRIRITLLLLALAVHRPADAQTAAEQRTQFRSALAAADAGLALPVADAAALRDYVLYPYVEAARLRRALERAPAGTARGPADDAAIAFLDRHADEPFALSVRRALLNSLAARRLWPLFLEQYREVFDDSLELRCQRYAARIATADYTGLADQIAESYLTPKSAPPACDTAFDWLAAQGQLTPALIERRARSALTAGDPALARYLARALPPPSAAPLLQWAQLLEQPQVAIDALAAAPARAVEPEALRAGFERLARRDVDSAMLRHARLVAARNLSAAQASPLAAPIALDLAQSRRREALPWFAGVASADRDEKQHEWSVRAALWAGDWQTVAQAIAAMPEALRTQNRWRYFAARAAAQLGDAAGARAGYAAVLPTDNWYAALSAARLGQKFAPTPRPIAFDEAQIDVLARRPALQRARELHALAMPSEAGAEWRHAVSQLTEPQRLQALALPSRWGWYIEAIAGAAKLGVFDDYVFLYPRPFDREVRGGVALTGVAPELIYAVLRQESLYRADARSSAGALGLMQMLPATAAAAARRHGRPAPTRSQLLQPSINVPLGAAELRSLLSRFEGSTPLALSGYNAGPGNARRWLPEAPRDIDVWVENIPFNETRTYVQRVSWHSLVFGWLNENRAQDTSAWLGQIQPPAPPP